MKNFLLYLWQLPQNLLGALLVLIYKPEGTYEFNEAKLHYASRMRHGISLGRHIIVSSQIRDYNGTTERHEYGHYLQSRKLGWLYLLVVGLPSFIWACWWTQESGVDYYSFWTEKWADKLGGVER